MTSSPTTVAAADSLPVEQKAPRVTSNKIETVTRHIEERISNGEWEEHQQLPSQSQLSREYGVSFGTIAIALRSLHKKGCIDLVPYKGARVLGSRPEGGRSRDYPLIALRGSYVKGSEIYPSQLHGASAVSGVIDAADAEHCPLLLFPKSPDGEAYDLSHYRSRGVRGTIFLGGDTCQEALSLREEGFPVLLANQPITPTPLNYIDYDHSSSLSKVMDLFHDNGHRRIAVIFPPTTVPGYFNALLPNFLTHLATRGNFYDPTSYWRVVNNRKDADIQQAIHELLSLKEPPTAIFAMNPALAIQVMTMARERGLRVPEDLSLIGSCFHSPAEMPVSGFVLSHNELGKCLLHEIHATIENPFHSVQKLLPLSFVDRKTVAPRRRSKN